MVTNVHLTVSVIIPVFNGAQYVCGAIESVLGQTYRQVEIIVIDDGSTDGTKHVLEPYIREGKIKYIFQDNRGLSAARNAGIKAASGKYLKFLDCDDFLYPKQVQLQVEHLANTQGVISVTDHKLAFYNGREIDSHIDLEKWDPLARLIIRNFTPVHSILAETDLVAKAGGFDEELTALEDADLWLRLLLRGAKMEKTEYVGCCYRIFNRSMSSDAEKMFRMKCKIAEKLNGFLLPVLQQLSNPRTEALLISNSKLFEGCYVRGLNPETLLPETLKCTQALFVKYKPGLKGIVARMAGFQNYIWLKHRLNCILKKNYAQSLLFDEIGWRSIEGA